MQDNPPTILITGAAGFIGFHLCKYLLEQGKQVLGLDNLNDYYDPQLKHDRLKELGISVPLEEKIGALSSKYPDQFTFVKGNLEDDEVWKYLGTGFDIGDIIHLAAQAGVRYSLENPKAYISSNINGFLQVLEFCRNKKITHLIYASSSSVYGMNSMQPFSEEERCDKPISLYAATKRSNEMMAYTYFNLYGIRSMGLRFFTVYGPWGRPDMAPMIFSQKAMEGEPIKVFNHGNQSRDFTYIDDIVRGIDQVFESKEKIQGADICNIGNGSPIRLMDFIAAIEQALGMEIQKEYLDAQPGDVQNTYADTSKLADLFGYRSETPIQDGVKKFMEWYKGYYGK
jgi:UDP-glucuronate 4-epimerase